AIIRGLGQSSLCVRLFVKPRSIAMHHPLALILAWTTMCLISMNSAARAAVPLAAEPFDLRQVRLLDGPFKAAQDLDARYILSLDPDRLLHVFRLNANLPSTAQPLGGWEAPNCEVRGHFVGHYLSACAQLYAATGDPHFKQRADYLVVELA